MTGLFFVYLSNTLNITFFILLLLLMEPLLKKHFSAICLYRIWAILLIGLLIPLRFEASSPLFHLGLPRTFLTDKSEAPAILPFSSGSITNPAGLSMTQLPSLYRDTSRKPALSIGSFVIELLSATVSKFIHDPYFFTCFVWLTGAFLILLFNLLAYYRYRRHMKKYFLPVHQKEVLLIFRQCLTQTKGSFLPNFIDSLQDKRIALYHCPLLSTPMTIGVIKPILLLPDKSYSKKDLNLLLMHEMVHIRRRDSLIKYIQLAALSLHWFNPFCYILLKYMDNWCEAACDEMILEKASRSDCMHYSRLLLECASSQFPCHSTLFTNFNGGKNNMKQRLLLILNQTKKRSGKIITALFLAIVGTTAIITITNQDVFASNHNDTATTPAPISSDSTAASLPEASPAPVSNTASSLGEQAVAIALEAKDTPYIWGGNDLNTGADSSGFVQAVYKKLGYELPRTSKEQYKACSEVSLDSLLPGDLVFYSTDGTDEITHVALYVGNGQIIHSKNLRDGVVICDIAYHGEYSNNIRTPYRAGRIITE